MPEIVPTAVPQFIRLILFDRQDAPHRSTNYAFRKKLQIFLDIFRTSGYASTEDKDITSKKTVNFEKEERMIRGFFFLATLLLTGIPVFAQSVDTAWVRRYNGPGNGSDAAHGVVLDGSGNVYVTGYSYGDGTDYDYATIKYYPNGDTAWLRRYNGSQDSLDGASTIAVDASDNVYVTGGCDGWVTVEFPKLMIFGDYATIKYDPDGDTAWTRRYNGPGNDLDGAFAIALDGSGNVFVTGGSFGETSFDHATIKYLPNGDTAWVRRYNGTHDYTDVGKAIAVDGSGNVYVTGWTDYNDLIQELADYVTIKYYPDGDTAWVRRYDGPGNHWDEASAIAVDGSGNVCVTGSSLGSGTSGDYATIKYDPDGDTAWVRRYNEPGNGHDRPSAIAVDNSGNVYVTGDSPGSGTFSDYATIRYYPNGDTAWVRRYSAPGDSAVATAIAVDSYGNTYVTGYSWSGTDFDYATVKYDSSGNELWVETYNGLGNGDDKAWHIAVCGCDTVYVTGESYGSGTDKDYVTIKYVQKETSVEEQKEQTLVCSFTSYQNYPNPFNQETIIQYSLRDPVQISLKIYNLKGQLVKTLVDYHQESGIHQAVWDGKDEKSREVSAGIYFYRLKVGEFTQTRKMVLLK